MRDSKGVYQVLLQSTHEDDREESASANGASLTLANKTGESVVQIHSDEYGNGVVGAYNRKGVGRTLQPGP